MTVGLEVTKSSDVNVELYTITTQNEFFTRFLNRHEVGSKSGIS